MSYDTKERLTAAMRGIVGDRPYTPDLDQIQSRGRKMRRNRLAWRATAGSSFAVAAIAAIAVAITGSGTQAPAPNLAATKPGVTGSATAGSGENVQLVQLVGYLTAAPQPEGDATLLLRDQVFTDGKKIDVWDLHADNGDYYFAKTRDALPAQVNGGHKQSGETGRKNLVAAATYAAKGDLNEARKRMRFAYLPKNPKVKPGPLEEPGATPTFSEADKQKAKITGSSLQPVNGTDRWVWQNSMEALMFGAGSPAVRAGVLRLLGQMPEVEVKEGTLKGQPVLTLTAGPLIVGEGTATETLTINADTGLPIKFATVGGTINYTVTRVTLAAVAAGKF